MYIQAQGNGRYLDWGRHLFVKNDYFDVHACQSTITIPLSRLKLRVSRTAIHSTTSDGRVQKFRGGDAPIPTPSNFESNPTTFDNYSEQQYTKPTSVVQECRYSLLVYQATWYCVA